MTQNFLFILRKDNLTTTGEKVIYFRVYKNRKNKYLSTNISTLENKGYVTLLALMTNKGINVIIVNSEKSL
ncbi:MAG: hypothetical protein JW857_03405 [Bacteroidales bacterium]|nr:hypothetical protein [Bacteroidales bacterium]MBN2788017.1 hypothetical protein [Paludibacteraceae bacterium]